MSATALNLLRKLTKQKSWDVKSALSWPKTTELVNQLLADIWATIGTNRGTMTGLPAEIEIMTTGPEIAHVTDTREETDMTVMTGTIVMTGGKDTPIDLEIGTIAEKDTTEDAILQDKTEEEDLGLKIKDFINKYQPCTDSNAFSLQPL